MVSRETVDTGNPAKLHKKDEKRVEPVKVHLKAEADVTEDVTPSEGTTIIHGTNIYRLPSLPLGHH